jgi:hypothetical protein
MASVLASAGEMTQGESARRVLRIVLVVAVSTTQNLHRSQVQRPPRAADAGLSAGCSAQGRQREGHRGQHPESPGRELVR